MVSARGATSLVVAATVAWLGGHICGVHAQTGWSADTKPAPNAAKTPTPSNAEKPAPRRPAAKPTPLSPPRGDEIVATGAVLIGDASKTLLSLDFSRGAPAEVYTLANPYRVVIDLPEVSFKLPEAAGKQQQGLVRMFRYGLFAPGKARVVIDTAGPVSVDKAEMTALSGDRVRLSLALAPTTPEAFGAGTGARKQGAAASPAASAPAEPKPGAKTGSKPVIVIDAGHGGIDPGAVSAGNVYEKNVVLAVAQKVKAALAASGRYNVVMTRATDVFVSLDQRVRVSEDNEADLFISLHADSIEAKNLVAGIRGASVYTLSEKASDEEARRAAEKENASDVLAGIEMAEPNGRDEVKNILFDLMKRETSNFAADFSRVLISKLAKSTPLNKDRQRAAAFKVLRQTHSPSVLVELGYMSNPEDEKLLVSPEWQTKVAGSIAAAVDVYFGKRTSRAP